MNPTTTHARRHKHKPLPLVGLIEIARQAGVRRPVVSTWRTRHADFPRPVAELEIGPVFWGPDVVRWLLATGRSTNHNRRDIWPAKANTEQRRARLDNLGESP